MSDKTPPQKTARIPVHAFNVKDMRGRILHWRASLGHVEGQGPTEREAIDDLTARLVELASGLEHRTRLVQGPHFGTAIILPDPAGWGYQMLRVDEGDGPADERIRLCSSAGGYRTADEAEEAAKAHAHGNAHTTCMSCKEERRIEECRCYETRSSAAVHLCETCIAGHTLEGAQRRAAEGMPYPERDIESWSTWQPSTEAAS